MKHDNDSPVAVGHPAIRTARVWRGLAWGRWSVVVLILIAVGAVVAWAQQAEQTAREVDADRGNVAPVWTNRPGFQKDTFTFVRLKYSVAAKHGLGRDPETRWQIDFPDSELNFSYRLQQVTSLKVDTDPKFVSITDKELFNYPFIYVVEPGRMTFKEEEVPILRKYLLNGGFVMFDDFWGDIDWENCSGEMKRVFPDREPIDLPLTHPIFNCVFPLKAKPQVPGFPWGVRHEFTGITYEQNHGPGAEEPHYRALLDDKGRIMVLFCHNTDLGDGWEKEGESPYYFSEFGEKWAFPLGINIVFYAMTH